MPASIGRPARPCRRWRPARDAVPATGAVRRSGRAWPRLARTPAPWRLVHRTGQFVDHRAAASFEEHFRMAHVIAVVVHGNQLHAGRRATPDLVLQARSRAVPEIAVLALAHLEQLLHQVEAFAHGKRARIRPEIAPRHIACAAMKSEPRIVLATREVDIRIALVVAQQDVVARLERFDQLRFEQQRFALGARHRDVRAGDLRHHGSDARLHPRLEEVAADTLLQVAGLADIQQIAVRVEVTIDARRSREGLDESLAVEGLRR